MGAKLSKGRSNPCGCFPRLRKKTKVVPMSSLDVAQRGVTPSTGPLSLPALLRPADPAVRLGWKSDLVLEDVDIEEETGRIARPILPLPPVVPPPWMRAPALQLTTPAATPAEQEMPAQADLPGFIQDTIEEAESKEGLPKREPAIKRSQTMIDLMAPAPVYHAAMIDTELSRPEYIGCPAEDKEYVKEEKEGEGEGEVEEEEEEGDEHSLNETIQEILLSPHLDDEMEKLGDQYEDLDEEHLHAAIQEILSTPEDKLQDCSQNKMRNVTPVSTSELFPTSYNSLPPLRPCKRVRFAL